MVETVMASWLLAPACTTLCIVATILNIIFILCLCRPAEGPSIRQPLYFLLTVMLGNSTVHQLIVMIYVILNFLTPSYLLLCLIMEIINQTFSSSFSSCAWISIVYYLKIVPQHHVIFLWIKKNIKLIVYVGFVFDQVLLLCAVTMNTIAHLPQTTNNNSETSFLNVTNEKGMPYFNNTLLVLSIGLYLAYFICPVSALSYSWGRTFYYLIGHIKRMEQTISSSSKQQRNQMRVTIMGIVQTVVFIPSSLWVIIKAVLYVVQDKTLDNGLFITLTSLCGLANILCLGFSQSVFRVHMISTVKGFKEMFRM